MDCTAWDPVRWHSSFSIHSRSERSSAAARILSNSCASRARLTSAMSSAVMPLPPTRTGRAQFVGTTLEFALLRG